MKSTKCMVAVLLIAGACLAQTPAPKAIRLIAEAEDFTVKSNGWTVVPFRENYFASTFAISFLSRHGCLGAPEQVPQGAVAVAEQVVTVPVAGPYEVLVRYEQPYNFSAEFAVEIEQGGKVVERKVCGKLEDPKIWALNGHQRKPMERFWWGGTDNIVWQNPGNVTLAAGPAVIRLVAGTQMDGNKLRINAGRRNVDVVVLTNDKDGMEAQKKTNYLEFDGWLTQDGDVFVRITNPKDAAGPCMPIIAPMAGGQHSPYYIHIRDWPTTKVLKSGQLIEGATNYVIAGPRSVAVNASQLAPVVDAAKFMVPKDPTKPDSPKELKIPASEYLKPGDVSGWVPMGQVLDSLHNCQWYPQAVYTSGAGEVYLKLEFAVSDGKGGLKPVKESTVKGKPAYFAAVTFDFPGNMAPNPAMAKVLQERFWLPEIRTQKEAIEWLTAQVGKFPRRGPVPKRFLIYAILGFSGAADAFPEAKTLAVALGDNTGVDQKGKKRGMFCHWADVSPKFYEKADVSDLYVVSYGDETHLPSVPVSNDVFAAWLKGKGVEYSGPVQWTKDMANPLYYYSVICGVEQGAKPYIAASAYYKGKGTVAGANYSPHANYLVTEMHYVRPFKMNALTLAWSEDYVWQIPEFSVQVAGYLTSAFRAGCKYNNQPIMMYVMPHSPGNTPADFRRSFYTCLANGMKTVNYFCASPLAVGGTENYVATEDVPIWREIYNVSHEAGTFEDYMMDGKVRPAQVGLLLSSVDDIMTGVQNSTLAMHNNERKAMYYALRHSQVPVDMLSEDDVIEGLAKDYKVIYVTQQWMHSKCLEALKKWAEAGGTVVALCGGGFTDEFNKPNPKADEFYGVKGQQLTTDPQLVSRYLLEANRPFLTKQDLPLYDPIDYVSWSSDSGAGRVRDVPVIVWKQALTAGDGSVLGTYRDGTPAVVMKAHGKGRAYLFGFLPGQAYLKSGLPVLPPDRGSCDSAFAHYLPTTMDAKLRDRLVADFLPSDFVKPVECSETLVEYSCIDTERPVRKLGIPLVNFTPKSIPLLSVKVNGLSKAAAVRSVERGVLKPVFEGNSMRVDLPLDIADMLLVDL